ncbi:MULTISPECIES: acyl carrier protein [Pseudomonas]|uniref:acyl carrier protein n=1 Tax=Pseudomonas TaxID=286 RepID=UPI000944D013|nr:MULTISPECIES: phosphopantetheine-binding protein [Pseudomonas]WPN65299.1 phosphopantetheine-binding protein [Pseudomonas sp. P9_32]WPN71050.1 phosphopantetheine-binding protein [Pseudomonas sp. P9_35]
MNQPSAGVCIDSEVMKLLSDYFSLASRKLGRSSRLIEDLSADSVDVIEIIMIIDEVFGVELSSEQIIEWRTVADVVYSVAEAAGIEVELGSVGEQS